LRRDGDTDFIRNRETSASLEAFFSKKDLNVTK